MIKQLVSTWNWGESIELIDVDSIASLHLSFEKSNPGVCYLSSLVVHPNSRRQGVATALMKEAFNICSARTIFRIDLRAAQVQWLIDFYGELGFEVTGDGKEDEDGLILMYKFLN